MHRFYWLDEPLLAGCSRPGSRPDDPEAEDVAALDEDLRTLREHGISAVLTLTEAALPEEATARHGLIVLHLPVDDYTAPTTEQFVAALAFLDAQRAAGVATAVHCKAGVGRTGSILAASRIRAGMSAEEAIAAIRVHCPEAVETEEQAAALERLALERPWLDIEGG